MRNIVLLMIATLPLFACSSSERLPPLPNDGVILAFGDSITYGTGANPDESYPAILERITQRRVVNAGVPGEVTAEGLNRLPEVLEREKPAFLILCHGGNDLLQRRDRGETAGNLRSMINLAREQGITVVLIGVPAPEIPLKPPAFYGEIAGEYGVPYDNKTLAKILGKGSLKSDYIHPNAAGYRILAEALTDLLKAGGAL